jgi:hypothetical protein
VGQVISGGTLFALVNLVCRDTGIMARVAGVARLFALLFGHRTGHVMVHGAGSIHDAHAGLPLERHANSQQAGQQET